MASRKASETRASTYHFVRQPDMRTLTYKSSVVYLVHTRVFGTTMIRGWKQVKISTNLIMVLFQKAKVVVASAGGSFFPISVTRFFYKNVFWPSTGTSLEKALEFQCFEHAR